MNIENFDIRSLRKYDNPFIIVFAKRNSGKTTLITDLYLKNSGLWDLVIVISNTLSNEHYNTLFGENHCFPGLDKPPTIKMLQRLISAQNKDKQRVLLILDEKDELNF